jgi:hypothetical protein
MNGLGRHIFGMSFGVYPHLTMLQIQIYYSKLQICDYDAINTASVHLVSLTTR